MSTILYHSVGSLKGTSMLDDWLNGLYKIIQVFFTHWLKREVTWDEKWMDSVYILQWNHIIQWLY